MDKTVAILQSNYIPWKGYFHLIKSADVFIFYDNVQYTKQDWRNRNQIKTSSGKSWLTIPVGSAINRTIEEVKINDHSWQKSHFNQILNAYKEAPNFGFMEQFLTEVYLEKKWGSLSELNQSVIRSISSQFLGIPTEFKNASDEYALGDSKGSDRILEILQQEGAARYVSGPAAKAYLDPLSFKDAGIELAWMNYPNYKQYEQVHPPFDHHVTVLDLLLHTGDRASEYIWGTASGPQSS